MGLVELAADCRSHEQRLAATNGGFDARTECSQNLWPWLAALVEGVQEELQVHANAIDELLEKTEDLLHAPLARRILETFARGAALADELDKLIENVDPAVGDRVRLLTQDYRRTADEVAVDVATVTVDVTVYEDDENDEAVGEL